MTTITAEQLKEHTKTVLFSCQIPTEISDEVYIDDINAHQYMRWEFVFKHVYENMTGTKMQNIVETMARQLTNCYPGKHWKIYVDSSKIILTKLE